MRKRFTGGLLAAGLLAACQQGTPRQAAIVPMAVAGTAPAEIEAAISEKGDPDSTVDAVVQLAELLSRHARNVAYLQQLTQLCQQRLTTQLKFLATAKDPEATARAVRLLAFTDALSRLIADELAKGDSKSDGLVAWALEPAHVMAVAEAYDQDPQQRVLAVRELATFSGDHADRVLARLIADLDREVALAAMDAAYDRAPSQVLVDALWNKAIVWGLRAIGLATDSVALRVPRTIEVRGRTVQIYDYTANLQAADGEVAADVLLSYKSELVKQHLVELFEKLGRSPGSAQTILSLMSPRYGTVSANAMRLIGAYRPPNAVPVLMSFVAGAADGGREQIINGQACYFSARIDLMGFVVTLADLDKEQFHLTPMQNWASAWVVIGSAKEEAEGYVKMREWWKANYRKYGAASPDIAVPFSDPGGYRGRFRRF